MSKVTDRTLDDFRALCTLNNVKYHAIASQVPSFGVDAQDNVLWDMIVQDYELSGGSSDLLFVHETHIEYKGRSIELHKHVQNFMHDMRRLSDFNEAEEIGVRDIVRLCELHSIWHTNNIDKTYFTRKN